MLAMFVNVWNAMANGVQYYWYGRRFLLLPSPFRYCLHSSFTKSVWTLHISDGQNSMMTSPTCLHVCMSPAVQVWTCWRRSCPAPSWCCSPPSTWRWCRSCRTRGWCARWRTSTSAPASSRTGAAASRGSAGCTNSTSGIRSLELAVFFTLILVRKILRRLSYEAKYNRDDFIVENLTTFTDDIPRTRTKVSCGWRTGGHEIT